MFRGCLGGIEGMASLTKRTHLSVPNCFQRKRETLLLGLYAGLILLALFLVLVSPLVIVAAAMGYEL